MTSLSWAGITEPFYIDSHRTLLTALKSMNISCEHSEEEPKVPVATYSTHVSHPKLRGKKVGLCQGVILWLLHWKVSASFTKLGDYSGEKVFSYLHFDLKQSFLPNSCEVECTKHSLRTSAYNYQYVEPIQLRNGAFTIWKESIFFLKKGKRSFFWH